MNSIFSLLLFCTTVALNIGTHGIGVLVREFRTWMQPLQKVNAQVGGDLIIDAPVSIRGASGVFTAARFSDSGNANYFLEPAAATSLVVNGKVGIGTIAPTQPLSVVGTADMTTLSIGGTAVTATGAELNYVDGVTSAIQTQLNGKMAPSDTLTGAVNSSGDITTSEGGISGTRSTVGYAGSFTQTYPAHASAVYLAHSNGTGLVVHQGVDSGVYGLAVYQTNDSTINLGARADGYVAMSGLPSKSASANVIWSGGFLYYVSSTRNSKHDIQNLTDDWRKILLVQPRSFYSNTTNDRSIGYIAEEIRDLGLTNLLTYNDKNELQGLEYDRFAMYAIEIAKEHDKAIQTLDRSFRQQQADIASIQSEHEILQQENANMKSELSSLKRIVCKNNPSEDYCHDYAR